MIFISNKYFNERTKFLEDFDHIKEVIAAEDIHKDLILAIVDINSKKYRIEERNYSPTFGKPLVIQISSNNIFQGGVCTKCLWIDEKRDQCPNCNQELIYRSKPVDKTTSEEDKNE